MKAHLAQLAHSSALVPPEPPPRGLWDGATTSTIESPPQKPVTLVEIRRLCAMIEPAIRDAHGYELFDPFARIHPVDIPRCQDYSPFRRVWGSPTL